MKDYLCTQLQHPLDKSLGLFYDLKRGGVMPANSKKFIFALGIIILVLLAEGIFYWRLKTKEKGFQFQIPGFSKTLFPSPPPKTGQFSQTGQESNPEINPKANITNLQIAEKVLGWLESQKNEEGFYNFGVRCGLNGECQNPDRDGRAGLGVLWGYFKHYQRTKNPSDMEKINYLLDLYSNEEKVVVIQNVFWNCKWMYEMWQADFFTAAQKKKIEKICFRGSYYPPLVNEVKERIKTGEEEPELEVITQKKQTAGEKLSEEMANYLLYSSVYSSDFVAKYLWQKNEADLKEAKGYFWKAIDLWTQAAANNYLDSQCLLGIAAADLYRATKEEKYLRFAQTLVPPKENLFSLLEKTSCTLLAADLFTFTGQEEYRRLKDDLIKSLLDNNFDYVDYPGRVNNLGAFYNRENPSGQQSLYYFIRENGIIGGILSE